MASSGIVNDNVNEILRKSVEIVTSGPNGPRTYRICTTASGEFVQDGIEEGWRFTEVTLSSGSWTALGSLTSRKCLSIFNDTSIEIKTNSDKTDSLPAGYVGMPIKPGGERFYNAGDGVTVYAKAASGTPVIYVEELA